MKTALYQLTHDVISDVSFHIVGLYIRAVSVFGKNFDAVCGFLVYFCAVFGPPPPPLRPPSPHEATGMQRTSVLT